MPNLLPYDSIMWLQALPVYEWEPVPPVTPVADASAAANAATDVAGSEDTSPACDDASSSTPHAMQWVYKGLRWVAVPAWSQRENFFFDQIAQDERDQDALRNESRKPRSAHAPSACPPAEDPGPATDDAAPPADGEQ
jgi:hypothetical protein